MGLGEIVKKLFAFVIQLRHRDFHNYLLSVRRYVFAYKGSGDEDKLFPIEVGKPGFMKDKGNLRDGVDEEVRVEDNETLYHCHGLSDVCRGG